MNDTPRYFKANRNRIEMVDTGELVAIVKGVSPAITKKDAAMMASYCAQQMNHELRHRLRRQEASARKAERRTEEPADER